MMIHISGKGRQKLAWRVVYGCSLFPDSSPQYCLLGPYARPRTLDRAINFMRKLEDRNETSHWTYSAAREVAYRLLTNS